MVRMYCCYVHHIYVCVNCSPQEARIQMVRGISQELTNEKYHNSTSIAERFSVIDNKWTELQNKLDELRGTLSQYHDLMSVFSEMEDCLTEMRQLEVSGCVRGWGLIIDVPI